MSDLGSELEAAADRNGTRPVAGILAMTSPGREEMRSSLSIRGISKGGYCPNLSAESVRLSQSARLWWIGIQSCPSPAVSPPSRSRQRSAARTAPHSRNPARFQPPVA